MEFEDINKLVNDEFTNRLYNARNIFYEIYEACDYKFEKGCGSYLFDGQSYKYCNIMLEKQELLYKSVKDAKSILEIGTYMGHSLLIMLLSNPLVKITCVDISDTYTGPAVKVLNKYFNNAITFIHGDSLDVLPKLGKFDFFHIDGYHENDYITREFKLICNLNHQPTLRIIFDDQDNMKKLQEDISRNYKIISYTRPSCQWSNIYFELATL